MKKRNFPWLSVVLLVLVHLIPAIYQVLTNLSILIYDDMVVKGLFVNQLLVYSPFAFALLSLIYGVKRGFVWYIPLVFDLTFLPAIAYQYLFTHGEGGEAYLIYYGIISFIFLGLGSIFHYFVKKSRPKS